MIQIAKKILLFSLTACTATLLMSSAAEAQEQQTAKQLQPQGLNHAGIHALKQMNPDLTGSGVKFAVICRSITYIDGEPQNDYRPNTEHNCLKTEQFSFNEQGEMPAGISPHSTAICSILLGADPDAFNQQLGQFHFQGAAPQAHADIYEFWHFIINNVFPGTPPEADIITASIGNQYEDWWTRGIDSMAERYGIIVVAGIGNGSNVYDPPLYPAAGANVIGVGVVDSVNAENLATALAHFSLAHPEHSSFGPTADERCKPDIVAPGNCMGADANKPDRYKPTGNWSSYSTPIVAGTIGLLVQKAKQDPNLSAAVDPDGGNCVMKAILLNSAVKLPYWHKGQPAKDDDHQAPLDYIQGAGMLNAVGAYKHLIAGLNEAGNVAKTGWDLNQLQKSENQRNIYQTTVTEPEGKFIAATITWNKHYASAYPFEAMPEKDANLQLELWAIDPENPNNDYLLDYSDSGADNVEHIYVPADANYTNYQIVVSYSDIDEQSQPDTTQRYGLAWNAGEKQDSDSIFWYDLNADGIVNGSDFAVLVNNWLTSVKSPETYFFGDININGAIDEEDFEILRKHTNRQADWYIENPPQ